VERLVCRVELNGPRHGEECDVRLSKLDLVDSGELAQGADAVLVVRRGGQMFFDDPRNGAEVEAFCESGARADESGG
jgi:hypothetical protein